MQDEYDLARYATEIGYSDSIAIDLRAGDKTPDLRAIANKRALDPTVFDEHEPFFFGGIGTNDRWDSYNTRMGMTSLANYAADAAAGVPYLRSHNKQGDPVGGTLTGALEGKTMRADVYMIGDPESMVYIAKIRAGIVRDQSIGFSGGEYMCSICGKDMKRWMDTDGCMHFLGAMYPNVDKKGKPKAGGGEVMARATIENARLLEISGVYSGATPGAFIDKARSLSAAGQLEQRMLDFVQVRYGIKLPAQRHVHPVSKREGKMDLTEEEVQALRDAEKASSTRAKTLEASITSARAAIAGFVPSEQAEADLRDQIAWLGAERARLIPLADDGIAYRKALVEEALTEGARAGGTEFQRELYAEMLGKAPVATIRQMRDDWARTADKLFPKGRQTQEAPPAPVVDDKIKTRNDFAFKG